MSIFGVCAHVPTVFAYGMSRGSSDGLVPEPTTSMTVGARSRLRSRAPRRNFFYVAVTSARSTTAAHRLTAEGLTQWLLAIAHEGSVLLLLGHLLVAKERLSDLFADVAKLVC